MKILPHFFVGSLFLAAAFRTTAADDSPENHLPPHITQLTAFGERASWSPDGKFIAFQLAQSRDAAGVGHGIFVFDLEKASAAGQKKL